MSLDLGQLVGRAIIDDGPFQRTYSRLMRQMADLGRAGEKTAASTATLDESLTATGKAATTAGAGIERTTRASTSAAAAEDKAAAAASRHAQALAKVAVIMDETAVSTPRVQAATLRLAAAQARLNDLQASGTATTRQLASAQAGLIGAQRSLTAAQDAGAVAAGRFRTGLASTLKMAAELGLIIGGIEIARKAFEFVAAGKHLTDALNSVQAAAQATDAEMKPVRATVLALGRDLTIPKATAVDAAHAIDDLVRSGMTLPRAMAAARSALLLISVTNTSAALSARVLGDALDEFRLPATQAAHVATMLAAAATSTSGGLDTVFEALQYSGTRARSADIPLSDLLATIVDLSKAGLQGTTIGTGLAMAISKLANPSSAGAKALDDLGIKAWDAQGKFKGLPYIVDQVYKAKQRFGVNSEQFLKDITVVFGARAANAIAAFSGKGIEGLDRFQKRLSSFDLQKAADEMNRGVGAGFRQLGKEATAAGIGLYQKFEPQLAAAVSGIGRELPVALHTAMAILTPFAHDVGDILGPAWHVVTIALGLAVGALKVLGGVAQSMSGTLGHLATDALAVYAAFKGWGLLVGLWKGIQTALILTRVRVLELATTYRTLAAAEATMGVGSVAAIASIGGVGAAAGSAALAARRAAIAFGVFRFAAVASVSANADQISAIKELVAQYKGATDSTDLSAKAIVRWAATSGDAVLPVKAVTKDLKITADQLAAGVSGTDAQFKTFIDTLRTHGKVSGDDINVLDKLHDAFKNTAGATDKATAAADKNTAAAAANNAILDKAAAATHVVSDTAKTYAAMLGVVVDTSGGVVANSKAVDAAVRTVAAAYNTATQAGADFLAADQAFSTSVGTAAERATLIGATLKASNGDALAFAGTMAATTSAVDALTGAFKQQRDQLAQQSADQQKAADGVSKAHRASATATARVTAAEARLSQVRGNSKATAAQIKAAEAAVTSAQNSAKNSADRLGEAQTAAGKAGALAYSDTERAAIKFKKTAQGLTATIDTNAKGAGDLVTQLQGIQDAAVKAAGAMFQHERSTKGATLAADDAYNVYVSKTKGALIDSATQLGLTKDQAKALAKAYYDTPSKVKTLIEAEGTDPVVTVLTKIGRLLANFTGQPWDTKVRVVDQATASLKSIHDVLNNIPRYLTIHVGANNDVGKAVHDAVNNIPGHADGGTVRGPGGPKSDSILTRLSVGEEVTSMPYASGWRPLLRAINSGALGARMPALATSRAAGVAHATAAASGPAGDSSSRPIQLLGDFKQTINYPEPEPVSRITPRALRMARLPLDGL